MKLRCHTEPRLSQTRIRSVAGCAERREVRHPQRAVQRGDEPRELPGDQEQVSGPKVQGKLSSRWWQVSLWLCVCLSVCVSSTSHCPFVFSSAATGAGPGDRGAAAQGSLPEHDRGPGTSFDGPQHSLQWGGVSGWVAPAPQQGVHVWKQTCQCSAA